MWSSSAIEESTESQNYGVQKLVNKIAELEMSIKELKQEQKMMEKFHIMDMRARDKKEAGIIRLVAICAIAYAVLALITRGFV
jgi:hypothetical protein